MLFIISRPRTRERQYLNVYRRRSIFSEVRCDKVHSASIRPRVRWSWHCSGFVVSGRLGVFNGLWNVSIKHQGKPRDCISVPLTWLSNCRFPRVSHRPSLICLGGKSSQSLMITVCFVAAQPGGTRRQEKRACGWSPVSGWPPDIHQWARRRRRGGAVKI